MGIAYTLSDSCSWAVISFALHPTPLVHVNESAGAFSSTSTLTFPAFASSGTYSLTIPGDGGEAAAGDLLVACFVDVSTRSVTPPTGWTTLTATGSGTQPVKLTVCYKIAAAGDISSGPSFTWSTSGDCTGTIHAIRGGTFDSGSGVEATATATSSSDGSTAHSPASFAARGEQIIDIIGLRQAAGNSSPVASAVGDPGTDPVYFLNQQLNGHGTGAPVYAAEFGNRWIEAADQWHVGSVASGANWT